MIFEKNKINKKPLCHIFKKDYFSWFMGKCESKDFFRYQIIFFSFHVIWINDSVDSGWKCKDISIPCSKEGHWQCDQIWRNFTALAQF